MKRKTILILWDSAHLWGLMAFRAMHALGLPCRLIKAKEISQGAYLGKSALNEASILLVPGGNARQKAQALGPSGMNKIRRWVAEGGFYLGICGGAGFALSAGETSLGLCPIQRASFEKRFYHFLSGHILATLHTGAKLRLPIWWPGRFAQVDSSAIEILARYQAPAEDLWLADLPLSALPKDFLEHWAKSKELDPKFGFPGGEPLVLKGAYGKGSYLLSYAHLETPASPEANAWLIRLLADAAELFAEKKVIPEWCTHNDLTVKQNSENSLKEQILDSFVNLCQFIEKAIELGLLFKRKEWLLGWQSGFSGIPCNNLLAAMAFLVDEQVLSPAPIFQEKFAKLFSDFLNMAYTWLWSWKLEKALSASEHLQSSELAQKQLEIFGNPMLGGGLLEDLLNIVEEQIWLAQPRT